MEANRSRIREMDQPSNSLPDERNPFLLPTVLERLFDVCELEDLFKYRLVCKQWYSVSLTPFRNEMILQLHNADNGSWLMDEDLQVGNKPFRSVRVEDVFFCSPGCNKFGHEHSDSRKFDQFWEENGAGLRKLYLRTVRVHSVEALKRVIFELTPNLQELAFDELLSHNGKLGVDDEEVKNATNVKINLNLTSLSIEDCFYLPITWPILFTHFPNIQTLAIDDRGSYDLVRPLTMALENLNLNKKEEKFKSIDLKLNIERSETPASITNLLQVPILKLTELKTNLLGFWTPLVEMISCAMVFHGRALKKLKVTSNYQHNVDDEAIHSLPFPTDPLSSLTYLELRGNMSQNLHFLEKMPNLRRLVLFNPNRKICENIDLERMAVVSLPNLVFLKIRTAWCRPVVIPKNVMDVLGQMMPNMEHFQGFLDKCSFISACKNWPKLRVLKVKSVRGVTNCKGASAMKLIDDECITGVVPGLEERQPCVRDLKYLRHLKMDSQVKFYDVSVWEGFLQMPNLDSLSVFFSHELSDQAAKIIRTKFPLLPISIFKRIEPETSTDSSSSI